MPRQPTVTIKRETLLRRVEQALRERGRHLRPDYRGGPENFFMIDIPHDEIVQTNVNLETIARRLKVMKPWEKLAKE